MSMTTREIREAYPPQSCALDTSRSCIGRLCPKWKDLTDREGTLVCIQSRTKDGRLRVLSEGFRHQCREEHEVKSCWQCQDAFGHCS